MHNSLLLNAHGDVFNGVSLHPYFVYERSEDSASSFVIHAIRKKNLKLHDAKKAMKVDLQHVSYIISIIQLLVTVSPRGM